MKENESVILCYTSEGLLEKAVYDTASDTAYIESNGTGMIHENFRTGTGYTVVESEETSTDIYGTEVSAVSTDGVSSNTLAQSASSQTYHGFQDEASLKAHLESTFVPYTSNTAYANIMKSELLDDWISIAVRESWHDYQKKSADFSPFAIGTAITIISLFLGPPPGIVIGILTALGIAISGGTTIAEAVTLYRSAVYTYKAERVGCAYDDVTYDEYVRVVTHYEKGEFTGGYTADGDFDWVHSKVSSAFDYDYLSIADLTLSNYEHHIYTNGYCSLFVPYQPF